jgi:hypothetical protein
MWHQTQSIDEPDARQPSEEERLQQIRDAVLYDSGRSDVHVA